MQTPIEHPDRPPALLLNRTLVPLIERGPHASAEESAGTDSARMWRTWLTADTAVPQGQAQQVPFCTG